MTSKLSQAPATLSAYQPPAHYRQLSQQQQQQLIAQRNRASCWENIYVSPNFDSRYVYDCNFVGSVWIGQLSAGFLRYRKLCLAIGLYHCNFHDAIIGDDVALHQVHYLRLMRIDERVILFAVDELVSSPECRFGYGLAGEGSGDYGLELGNENGGRIVYPFAGMRSADAWLWSRFRHDSQLLECFSELNRQQLQQLFAAEQLPAIEEGGDALVLGRVGRHSVIKACRSINDCWIGEYSYIKGANKLKNLSILSSEQQPVQIGEGVELVNGIIASGCKIFYGCKAVRFVCDQNSQLKYGARLINSYLGANSTVSCCELLNSLLFPAHEQHHNNSFLVASTIGGQSNIAAGANLGSNHNSRAADGELLADRGFWPGLNCSLKYNCRFAAFTLLAKGDYPAEMNIPYPFSLLSYRCGHLEILPGYWFRHNIYALERNSWKFKQRDQRHQPQQIYHSDYLAADTAEQIYTAIELLQQQQLTGDELWLPGLVKGQAALLHKAEQALQDYRQMLEYYIACSIEQWFQQQEEPALKLEQLGQAALYCRWLNCGGQIVAAERLQGLRDAIVERQIDSWEQVHQHYGQIESHYLLDNARYALHLGQLLASSQQQAASKEYWAELFNRSSATAQLILKRAQCKRQQDFDDPFRQSCYQHPGEQLAVLGTITDDPFLKQLSSSQQHYAERFQLLSAALKE